MREANENSVINYTYWEQVKNELRLRENITDSTRQTSWAINITFGFP